MIRKTVKEVVKGLKVNPYYEICVGHFEQIYKERDMYEIISLAFKFGYLQGQKATKAANYKKAVNS
ncbi:MAG: hypothetical protein FWF82_03685 [Oscillospiraceae bacterium]|nr:hypothetical protein [Oscillospiraceae bacterium]